MAPLLPSDDASYGFDNVTVGNLSPALLERYVSAARKVSRLAIGSRSKPGRRHREPAAGPHAGGHFDCRSERVEGSPSVHLSLDAEYEIQARLTRPQSMWKA